MNLQKCRTVLHQMVEFPVLIDCCRVEEAWDGQRFVKLSVGFDNLLENRTCSHCVSPFFKRRTTCLVQSPWLLVDCSKVEEAWG